MLERFCGRALREVVANDLIYPIARGEDAQQRQIINGHAWHTNPFLARAQTLMQSSIEEPLSIAKIAVACGISQRELERRQLFAVLADTLREKHLLGDESDHVTLLMSQGICMVNTPIPTVKET